jgi:hypothetical protein
MHHPILHGGTATLCAVAALVFAKFKRDWARTSPCITPRASSVSEDNPAKDDADPVGSELFRIVQIPEGASTPTT